MKRSVFMFLCFLMLIAMLGLLFFAGAIYDAGQKHTIDTFFFEPNYKSAQRILPPVSANSMTDNFLREKIIARFVNEYFYVIPDTNNARMRVNGKNTDGTKTVLKGLTKYKTAIFENWAKTVAPEIVSLADKKVLRTVRIMPEITESESGHLIVRYELKTWTKPNDVLARPETTFGELYLDTTKGPIHIEQTEEALQKLKQGNDPVSVFMYYVFDVAQK